MRTPQNHALSQLLNTFIDAFGEKFKRLRADGICSPRVTMFTLLVLVINVTDKGCDSALKQLWAHRRDVLPRIPAESTFCRARAKITEAMTTTAWESFTAYYMSILGHHLPRVHDHRLVAIDGVWVNGKRSKKLFKALRKKKDIKSGRYKMPDKGQPQLLVVVLVDALTKQPIAWVPVMPGSGERTAAKEIAKHLQFNDILLTDRGFPSRKLIEMLVNSGCRFVMRMSDGSTAFSEVQEIVRKKNKRDVGCRIAFSKKKNADGIEARLVTGSPRIGRPKKGKKAPRWTLLTNLPESKKWSRKKILDLYHERWAIEVFFREMKELMKADDFHAQTLDGLKQEINCAMFAGALISAAETIAMTQQYGRVPRWDDTKQKKCNRATLLTVIRTLIMLNPNKFDIRETLNELLGATARGAPKRRPGRIYERTCKSFRGKWKGGFKGRVA